MKTDNVPVYILAGGGSRRFGSDKARALVDGRPLIQHMSDIASEISTRIVVVAAQENAYADLGLETIADRVPGQGPLAGLQAAIADRAREGEGWLLLAACDWWKVDVATLRTLLSTPRDDSDVVAFTTDQPQPLLALYHTRVRDTVDRALSADDRSMAAFLRAVRLRELPATAGLETAVNINRRVDMVSDET